MRTSATMPAAMPGLAIEARGEMVPGALIEMEAAQIHGVGNETVLAHAVQAGPGAAVEAVEGSAGGGVIGAVADKLAGTGVGRKILGTAAGLMSAGAMVGPSVAAASESGGSNTTVTDSQTGVTVHGSHAWQKDGDHSHVTVMGNHRVVSKTEVQQAKEDGQCFWVNGKKVKMYTEGHNVNGTAFGRDYRKNLVCHVNEDVNGDGKVDDNDLVRAECGNVVILRETPQGAIEQVIWVAGKGKLRVHADSEATAKADCSTTDGHASAEAYGHGEASANGFVKLTGKTKVDVKKAQGKVDQLINQSMAGQGGAKSKAFAEADAQCTEGPGPGPGPGPSPNNNAPFVEVDNPNHIGASDTIAFCERESDSDGTIVDRQFIIKQGGGNFTSPVYPGNDPGEECRDYTSRSTAAGPDVILEVTVTDSGDVNGANVKTATADTAPFPVVDIPK